MEVRVPDYFSQFRCLAGECPHSCCSGWEVDIDSATASFYRTLPGALGDQIRNVLQSEDGTDFLSLTDTGRCPFWDDENLCEIHLQLGAEHTSEVCQSHPRFTEDYGSLKETSLCASCPEACRLLLASQEPLSFPLTQTCELGEPADDWLSPLLVWRTKALEILQDRQFPLSARLTELLLLTADAQTLLDADDAESLPELCRQWHAPKPFSIPDGAGLFPHALETLLHLEILGDDWESLLRRGAAFPAGYCLDALAERIAAYFLFRYALKSMNDGDLLGRVEFSLFSVIIVKHLSNLAELPEALRLYCREIEHNEENIAALLDCFQTDPTFSLERFLQELQKH